MIEKARFVLVFKSKGIAERASPFASFRVKQTLCISNCATVGASLQKV